MNDMYLLQRMRHATAVVVITAILWRPRKVRRHVHVCLARNPSGVLRVRRPVGKPVVVLRLVLVLLAQHVLQYSKQHHREHTRITQQ